MTSKRLSDGGSNAKLFLNTSSEMVFPIGFVFLLPSFLDFAVSKTAHIDREEGKKRYTQPDDCRRSKDRYPGSPDPLAPPELRFGSCGRDSGDVQKCFLKWSALMDVRENCFSGCP